MPSRPVKVFVRTRPTDHFASEINIDEEKSRIDVRRKKDEHSSTVCNKQNSWSFRLNRILNNSMQEQVYDECCRPLVDQVLQGYNGTVMAYGQTGAGKTFTMIGGQNSYKYRGMVPRMMQHVYEAIQSKPETIVTVRFSALEVYNNTLIDLLVEDGDDEPNLQIFDDVEGNVCVRGLKRLVAGNEEEALNFLFQAVTNRAVGPHSLNQDSSRSHAIFTIYLEMRSRIESSEKVVSSKIHMVDLAGSERIKKTGSSGLVLKEAGFINKSLSFLEQVVMALSTKNRDHIPYRSSKLTNFLRDALGGNCQTRLIANVWPEGSHLEETISTLKFASRMMRVTTVSAVNVQLDPMLLIKKYEREIRSLKQELAMHDTLAGRAPQQYDEYTPEQQANLMDQVREYCRGDISEIEVSNLRHIHEAHKQFRILVNQLENELKQAPSQQPQDSELNQEQKEQKSSEHSETQDEQVGEIDHSRSGFHVGTAPTNAKPVEPISFKTNHEIQKNAEDSAISPVKKTSNVRKSEEEALEEFQDGEGAKLSRNYQDQKVQLKNKKREMKALAVSINEAKRKIDNLVSALEQKKQNRPPQTEKDVEVIDEEEYSLLRDLNVLKKQYQAEYHKRQMLISEVNFLKGVVQQAKVKMCHEFLSWYRKKYGVSGEVGSSDEVLDDAEQFEKMETERIKAQDPGSLSFFRATKTLHVKQFIFDF